MSGLYKHAPRTPINCQNDQIIIRINLNANLKPNQINVPYSEKYLLCKKSQAGERVSHQISNHPSEQSVLSLTISFLSVSCIPLFILFFLSPSIPFEHIPDKFPLISLNFLCFLLSYFFFPTFFHLISSVAQRNLFLSGCVRVCCVTLLSEHVPVRQSSLMGCIQNVTRSPSLFLSVSLQYPSVPDIYTTYWSLYHTSHGTHTEKEGAGEDQRDRIR